MADLVCELLPKELEPFCEALPTGVRNLLYATAVGVALFVFIVRGASALRRWKNIWRLQELPVDDRIPRIRADADIVFIQPAQRGIFDLAMRGAQSIQAALEGRKASWRRLTRDDDDAELYEQEALAQSGRSAGLNYLPFDYRMQIHLRIAREYLEVWGAPAEARLALEERIKGLGQDVLIDSLFNPAKLRSVEVNADPASTRTYFSRFFQPLMEAFAEDAFRSSDGQLPDGHQTLLNHMKMLSDERLCAARIDNEGKVLVGDVIARLPQPVPGGFDGVRRADVKKFNKKRAAHSLLLLATPETDAVAQAFSSRIHAHKLSLSDAFIELTEDEGSDDGLTAYLWQRAEYSP